MAGAGGEPTIPPRDSRIGIPEEHFCRSLGQVVLSVRREHFAIGSSVAGYSPAFFDSFPVLSVKVGDKLAAAHMPFSALPFAPLEEIARQADSYPLGGRPPSRSHTLFHTPSSYNLPGCESATGTENRAPRPKSAAVTCFRTSTVSEHVLTNFEEKYPKDNRPPKAVEAGRAWVRGEIAFSEARAAAFAAHAAARDADQAAARAAARAAVLEFRHRYRKRRGRPSSRAKRIFGWTGG